MNIELALKLVCTMLMVLDAATTIYALTRWPTKVTEANPVMRAAINLIGVEGAMLVAKAAIIYALWRMPVHPVMLGAISAFYAWVVWHNVGVIRSRMQQ